MARPVSITRERILDAGLAILRREGEAGLSARTIAAALGCSTQPIYTAFAGMAGLEHALVARARAFFLEQVLVRREGAGVYEGIGLRLLELSRHEPRLFRWIMQAGRMALDFEHARGSPELEAVLKRMGEDPDLAGLDEPALLRINRGLWFVTYGLAVSLADGLVRVPAEVARRYLNEAAGSLIAAEQAARSANVPS
jgi:AcrR family transcriptional regulator